MKFFNFFQSYRKIFFIITVVKWSAPCLEIDRLYFLRDWFNQCHITRSVLPAFIPLCCSIDFWNSWCVSVKSSPNGKKFLSIFFCILAINQRNQITKVFNYEMFGTNPSSDGINCYEIEGKPVFGFWAHLLAKNTSLIICMI